MNLLVQHQEQVAQQRLEIHCVRFILTAAGMIGYLLCQRLHQRHKVPASRVQTLAQQGFVAAQQQFCQLRPELFGYRLPFGNNRLQTFQKRQTLFVERHFRSRHLTHLLNQRKHPVVVKKGAKQLDFIFLTRRGKCLMDSLYRRLAIRITQHGRVIVQLHIIQWRRQHNAFQRPATGKRHIDLSCRKSARRIDDHSVEGQALTLVDRYRPREPERILGERT